VQLYWPRTAWYCSELLSRVIFCHGIIMSLLCFPSIQISNFILLIYWIMLFSLISICTHWHCSLCYCHIITLIYNSGKCWTCYAWRHLWVFKKSPCIAGPVSHPYHGGSLPNSSNSQYLLIVLIFHVTIL
jgi:hypothetical protein